MTDTPNSETAPAGKPSALDRIAQFEDALRETRADLDQVEAEISTLEGKILAARNSHPHLDDIVASFSRGLQRSSETFKRQLKVHLNSANAEAIGAATAVSTSAGQLLTMEIQDRREDRLIPARTGVKGDALSVAAITYFLRDKIEAELPALVAEMVPASRSGMKHADRVAKIAEYEAELAKARERREEVKGILAAAQTALYRRT